MSYKTIGFSTLSQAALVSLVLLTACVDTSPSQAPTRLDVTVQQELVIGLEEDEHDILGQPAGVVTDSVGRIFILDRMKPAIRVYQPDGSFAYDIGSRGEGPGEFQNVHDLQVADDDQLLVIDQGSWRISRFSTDGEFHGILPRPAEGEPWVFPSTVVHLGGSNYVFRGRVTGDNIEDYERDYRLHHVRLSGSQQVEQSFLSTENDLKYDDTSLRQLDQGLTGSLLHLSSGGVLYAPGGYDGRLFHYRYDENEKAWRPAGMWRGYVEYAEAGREIDPGMIDSDEFEHRWMRAHTPEGTFGFVIHNESLALAELPDGNIAHFTHLKKNDAYAFGMELFTGEGELIGYGAMPQVGRPEPNQHPLQVEWVDDDGRLYLTDPIGEPPVVRVVELEYEEVES